ncbi:radical SAM protein [Anaerocolumna sp. AGMB13025]|uniref:radical SAM/SPASM domain-containing protein n=1 Tax=Anaerocolumna sp. AGMB13025 TaxID=3039116 RepID=UPI00241EC3B2|nr:radical SAM protein [Anaerocolumna sp. AGMB13025]WFR56976.1 radical SAM protein [Anaerocolumna sp. AGMB13025]
MDRKSVLKVYEENNKVILLNTDNCRWVRLSKALYQKRMQEAELFYEELNMKYELFLNTPLLNENMKSVYFALTKNCNLNCAFCSMNSEPGLDNKTDMQADEIIEVVIPKLKKLALKKIILTGGEPMIRKDILPIIREFSKAFGRDKLILQSNGLLLKEDMIPELSDYIGNIEISIENLFSNPVLMKQMEKVFAAIRDARIRLAFSFVVDRNSCSFIKEAVELCYRYQAVFEIRFVAPLGRAFLEEKIFTDMEILTLYLEVIGYILEKKYYTEELSGVFMPRLQAAKGCGGYGKLLSIQPDGNLYMCSNIREDVCELGNIINDCLETVLCKWEEKLKEVRIKDMFLVKEKSMCSKCRVKYFCTGPCAAEGLLDPAYLKRNCRLNLIFLKFMMFYYERKRSLEENLNLFYQYLNSCTDVDSLTAESREA